MHSWIRHWVTFKNKELQLVKLKEHKNESSIILTKKKKKKQYEKYQPEEKS